MSINRTIVFRETFEHKTSISEKKTYKLHRLHILSKLIKYVIVVAGLVNILLISLFLDMRYNIRYRTCIINRRFASHTLRNTTIGPASVKYYNYMISLYPHGSGPVVVEWYKSYDSDLVVNIIILYSTWCVYINRTPENANIILKTTG